MLAFGREATSWSLSSLKSLIDPRQSASVRWKLDAVPFAQSLLGPREPANLREEKRRALLACVGPEIAGALPNDVLSRELQHGF